MRQRAFIHLVKSPVRVVHRPSHTHSVTQQPLHERRLGHTRRGRESARKVRTEPRKSRCVFRSGEKEKKWMIFKKHEETATLVTVRKPFKKKDNVFSLKKRCGLPLDFSSYTLMAKHKLLTKKAMSNRTYQSENSNEKIGTFFFLFLKAFFFVVVVGCKA